MSQKLLMSDLLTVGPGSRLGYFTSSPSLLRILQTLVEGSTGAPSGISQAVVGQVLQTFDQDGFSRWLRGISAQYELRRWSILSFFLSLLLYDGSNFYYSGNWSIDVLFKHLHIDYNRSTGDYTAYKMWIL